MLRKISPESTQLSERRLKNVGKQRLKEKHLGKQRLKEKYVENADKN